MKVNTIQILKEVANMMKENTVQIMEAVPQKKELSFNDQITQNRIQRDGKGIEIDSTLYDWVHNKYLKGEGTITNKDAAIKNQKISIHTSKKHLEIIPFGNFLKVMNMGSGAMNSKASSTYFKVK